MCIVKLRWAVDDALKALDEFRKRNNAVWNDQHRHDHGRLVSALYHAREELSAEKRRRLREGLRERMML